MPTSDKPIIGMRQLAPILVVDALFIAAIIASILTGAGRRPYLGDMTLLQSLLIAFGIVSAALTYWCIVRPMRRAQAARGNAVDWTIKGRRGEP